MKHKCPHCGSDDVRYQEVKGEYGTYDTKNMYCRKCWKDFPTPKIRLPTLPELLGLPDGLSDAERGVCISIANHYGAEAAQDEARKILAKRSAS